MDQIDRKILGLLEQDSRLSLTNLAAAIPLGLSATSERLRRLTESGIIAKFTIQIDAAATGTQIEAFVEVRLNTDVDNTAFDTNLIKLDPVIDAAHLTGRFDYMLRVAAQNVSEVDELLATLKNDFGVEETNTRLILKSLPGFPRSVAIK